MIFARRVQLGDLGAVDHLFGSGDAKGLGHDIEAHSVVVAVFHREGLEQAHGVGGLCSGLISESGLDAFGELQPVSQIDVAQHTVFASPSQVAAAMILSWNKCLQSPTFGDAQLFVKRFAGFCGSFSLCTCYASRQGP